jgi:serine/threonine-protein kinase RsbW
LTSEVLTNAIRHSDSARPDGQVTLVITDCGEAIQVEVIDEGSATNTPQVRTELDGQSLGGRGLWLVDQMSQSWGSREHAAGRVVWFRMTKK